MRELDSEMPRGNKKEEHTSCQASSLRRLSWSQSLGTRDDRNSGAGASAGADAAGADAALDDAALADAASAAAG